MEGRLAMKLRRIDSTGVSNAGLAELPALRKRTDGFLWLDVPEWSDDGEAILANEFHFHPMAIAKSKNRTHVPRVHVYPDHVFIVVHAPEIGVGGHVHYLELDQFVGEHFLVTLRPHQPQGPVGGGAARDRGSGGPDGERPATPYLAIRNHIRDRLLDRPPRIANGRRDRP
jgi:Mg2+ and Co2+ transporter CorA